MMIKLYNRESTDTLADQLDLREGEHFTIETEQDETFFDGYADVYLCLIHVFPANYKPGMHVPTWAGKITHEALCYHHNGE